MDVTEQLPPPVSVINPAGTSPYLLICEHASRFIPASYKGLGLTEEDLRRHIAWDIGAADVATALSAHLDAPLVLAGYSRLLIDLNRPVGARTSIPDVSEVTEIPGNINISGKEREHRERSYFTPFQAQVTAMINDRLKAGITPVIVAIHSFTPVFKGFARPWHAGILYRRSKSFGHSFAEALGGASQHIAENEPYQIEDDGDYTVPIHGEARGLDAVLVEVRQDLIATPDGAKAWAHRLKRALSALHAKQ
ncbi:N-formylglutamate amidohydrolase [Aestuariivirga sp.]|uniref:N-formylglutamate amidohydrolase n=1 Tax=Aestuariivirga sp. TaxID=2650926 RepID=UPI0039E51A87